MGTLNPSLGSTISGQSPVVEQSGLGTAVNFVDALIGVKPKGDSTSSYSREKDAREQASLVGLQNGLVKANQLRAQGKNTEADKVERGVMLNFSRDGGDLGDRGVQETIKLVTGKDPAHAGLSQEEIMANKLRESPEYIGGLQASYAVLPSDATMEQREQYAFTNIAKDQAFKADIKNSAMDWEGGRKVAFSGYVQNFRDKNLGSLKFIAENGGIIPLEAIKQAKATWLMEKGNLVGAKASVRNLTQEQWKPIQDQIDVMDQTFDYLEKLSGVDGVNAQILSNAATGIAKSGVTDIQKAAVLNILIKDPAAIRDLGIMETTEFADMVKATLGTNQNISVYGMLSEDDQGLETTLPPEASESVKDLDNPSKLDTSKKITKVINDPDRLNLKTDDANRAMYIDMFSKSMAAIKGIADGKDFMSIKSVNEVFNGSHMAAIDQIASVEPTKARTLAANGYEATDALYAVSFTARKLMVTESGFDLDEKGVMSFERKYLTDRGVPEDSARFFEGLAGSYYGGNLLEMYADKGRRIPKGEWSYHFGNFHNGVNANIRADVSRLDKQSKLVKRLEAVRNGFKDKLDSFYIQGGEEDTQVKGSAGNDTLSASAKPLISLIDKREGKGDYNTLFDSSQREGEQFAGLKVSEMTIDELSQFSKGPYASYMKSRLGYVATPMGRYQIVGDTLRQSQKEMGLPGNIKFTSEVQDAIFHHLATKAISKGKNAEEKRMYLRKEWEGFKKVSDPELDTAIAVFEGSEAPDMVTLQKGAMQTAPSEATVRPKARGQTETLQDIAVEANKEALGGKGTRSTSGGSQGGSQAVSEASTGSEESRRASVSAVQAKESQIRTLLQDVSKDEIIAYLNSLEG